MTAGTANNYTVVRPQNVDAIQFGDTAWTTADYSSTTAALHTSFAVNNASPLLDVVGINASYAAGGSLPVYSAPFGKDITYSGNERSTTSDNLLGANSDGTQNQETAISPTSLQNVEMTVVYRNNTPFSIFNDTTKSCLMQIDNAESATTGQMNIACNNITMLHVGSLTLNPEGLMEQKIKFSNKGGTTGSIIELTDTGTWTSGVRVVGGDYAEEVRIT